MTTPAGRPAKRVRVTGPRGRSTPLARGWRVSSDVDQQSEVAEVFVASLVRTQLRLGLAIVLAFGAAVAFLPLAFYFSPGLDQLSWLGIRLPWWLLALAPYPLMIVSGWVYVRAAERAERDFTDLVGR